MIKGVRFSLLILASLLILPAVSAIGSTDWTNFSTGGSCEDGPSQTINPFSYWKNYWGIDDHFFIFWEGKPAESSCWFLDSASSTYLTGRDACCPESFSCETPNGNGPADAFCKFTDPAERCDDFSNNELSCNGTSANPWIAWNTYNDEASIKDNDGNVLRINRGDGDLTVCQEGGDYCCTNQRVRCAWKDSSSGSGKSCALEVTSYKDVSSWQSDPGKCNDPDSAPSATCRLEASVVDSCSSETLKEYVRVYIAKAYNSTAGEQDPSFFGIEDSCYDYNTTHECSAAIQVPFFGVWNFVFAGLGIVLVYIIFRRKLEADI